MSIYNKILCALIFTFTTNLLMAQSNGENGSSPNTNSPYSRYGFGLLSDQSFGNSKAMGYEMDVTSILLTLHLTQPLTLLPFYSMPV